jgi:DNA-binding transcriptional MerR regulator
MQNLKRKWAFILLSIMLGVSVKVIADVTSNSNNANQDAAYQQQLMNLSNQISTKITQIQAKQQQLNAEVYPAYKPPLQAELDKLNKELQALQLQRDQLQSQKTVQDLTKQFKDPKQEASQGSEKAAS